MRRAQSDSYGNWFNPTSFTQVKGIKTHFFEAGQGKPLVFVHGSEMWLYTWRRNLPALAKEFRVVAFDMKGYGFSEKRLDEDYSVRAMSQFISDFLEVLEIRRASFIGSSWGGQQVLDLALTDPEKVEKMMLCSPCGVRRPLGLADKILKAPLLWRVAPLFITRKTIRRTLEGIFFDKRLVNDNLVEAIYVPLSSKEMPRILHESYRGFDPGFVESRLRELRKSVLLLWGKQDRIHPREIAVRTQEIIANSKLEWFEECGHLPHEEKPEAFNKLSAEFLLS